MKRKTEELFEYWKDKTGHPRARLDDKRRRKLATALRFYSLAECKKAIDGCTKSAWHQGQNPNGKRYDQISLIFRDAEHVERFMEYDDKPPRDTHRDDIDDIIKQSRRDQWN